MGEPLLYGFRVSFQKFTRRQIELLDAIPQRRLAQSSRPTSPFESSALAANSLVNRKLLPCWSIGVPN
jgi:hypothetical protein